MEFVGLKGPSVWVLSRIEHQQEQDTIPAEFFELAVIDNIG